MEYFSASKEVTCEFQRKLRKKLDIRMPNRQALKCTMGNANKRENIFTWQLP
jgi:hypothetical protein